MFEYCRLKIMYVGNGKFENSSGFIYEKIRYKNSIEWIMKNQITDFKWSLIQDFQDLLEEQYNRIIREEKLKRILDGRNI